MCGICGLIQPNAQPDGTLVRRMTDTLRHRGPDGEGYLFDGPVGFGMRRLAVIDLYTGDQPIFSEDHSVGVVFNGEIFNYRSLREELEEYGHQFSTRSDTECIVHAYEQWGIACPTHLNGQFAFALWDRRQRCALLARDHLGIKPLYYAQVGNQLVFGSEMKALRIHPDCPHEIDPVALDQYLALRYIPAPRTIFRGVSKLPAAHTLLWTDGRITLQRYWDVTFAPQPGLQTQELADELRALLNQAVEQQMVADVPLGVFLSGGIDSSILVALMAQHSSAPVRTFSVIFPTWPGFDESTYAQLVAQRYATAHTEVTVADDVASTLPHLVSAFDEPFADPAALPTLLMAQATRRHVTVVLTGEGADELFAGYGWYDWADRRWPLPPLLGRHVHRLALKWLQGRRGAGTISARLAPDFATMVFESALSSVAPAPIRDSLYAPDWRELCAGRGLSEEFLFVTQLAPTIPEQSRMQEIDLKIWLEGDPLVKVDRTTMAVSLEARVPFLDVRVVELAARIPANLQRAGGCSKALLRVACTDLLPPEILARPKHAFEVPIDQWLRDELRVLAAENLLGSHSVISPMFNRSFIAAKWHEHQSGRRNHGRLLWALTMLALWAQNNQ